MEKSKISPQLATDYGDDGHDIVHDAGIDDWFLTFSQMNTGGEF